MKKDLESFLQLARDFEVRGLAEEEDLHESVPDSVIKQEHETINTLDDIKEQSNISNYHEINSRRND